MTKKFAMISLVAAASLVGACTTYPQSPVEPAQPKAELPRIQISGEAAYRERIALQPGMIFNVQLQDVSLADAPSVVIAEERRTLNGEQVPLPFMMIVPQHKLKTNMRYVMRATISTPDGRLAWTTDTSHPVSTEQPVQNLGTLMMVRVASDSPAIDLTSRQWNMRDMNGQSVLNSVYVTFRRDGTVNGNSGCNSFSGTYTVSGQKLTIGPLAMTKRACTPALNAQEARFMGILQNVTGWTTEDENRVFLKTDNGQYLLAEGSPFQPA